ncbi:MAG: hypothetical protein JNM17_34060 [Archangium sp.]|nr:hypothetical protein [Archangium sp.]
MKAAPNLSPEWIFDVLPPSGARRGGDPSEHVFKHELDTFVREVVQNANDQRVGLPRVDFTARELVGDDLKHFLDALRFSSLRAHLDAVGETRTAKRLRERLQHLERSKRLRVLRVEDRETVGLTGDENTGDSHFRALCKDVLFSHKRTGNAGGSFGLGKSVLWTFSGLSTVVFNSIPRECPPGTKPPRLIGRAELPSHGVGETGFAGAGWFGLPTKNERGRRAESVWSLNAAQCARELGIERQQLDSGTSILILDFREPAADSETSPDGLHERIRAAAARWFWPAMCFEGRSLTVSTSGARVLPDTVPECAPFVACYAARRTTRTTLEEAGDVCARELEVELPAKADGSPATKGRVRLLVRLAASAKEPMVGHVAMFRGAGMVIRYQDRSALAAQHRPFHALLCCGEARDAGAATASDRLVEAFLRDAEPPGHDEWESTPALKEGWSRGYAKALEQLKARVTQALKELVAPEVTVGSRGPELLQKRFPFGARGTPGSAPTAFHFSELSARLSDRVWHFEGELSPARGRSAWSAEIRLRELGDSGAVLRELGVSRLTSGRADATIQVVDGVARVAVASGTDPLRFKGTSEVLSDQTDAGVLSLEVTGSRSV